MFCACYIFFYISHHYTISSVIILFTRCTVIFFIWNAKQKDYHKTSMRKPKRCRVQINNDGICTITFTVPSRE